jgi:polysaccharide biosynthesis protein PslG
MSRRVGGLTKRAALTIAAVVAMILVTQTFVATQMPTNASPIVPPDGYGFSTGAAPEWMSAADANRELNAVATTGASWLRLMIDWNKIEPTKGVYDWGYVDHWINGAAARGLRILGLIAYSAAWARPPGTSFTHPPVDPADFRTFSMAVVNRYGDRVSHWEIWNEPNLPLFFGGLVNSGARYTELLKTAYTAIKAVQPNSTVVAAGLSRLLGDDSPPSFLQQMYAAGAKGFFDAAAAHPYVFPGGLAADPEGGWSDVGRMHDVMAANGEGGKKIWMTELGAPTSDPYAEGLSQEEQAKQITDVLAAAAATVHSGPAFIYGVRDSDSSARGNRENNFGALLTSDWRPKVAAAALAR